MQQRFTFLYAFGPAGGFGLSALCNLLYVSPGNEPYEPGNELTRESPNWIGAW